MISTGDGSTAISRPSGISQSKNKSSCPDVQRAAALATILNTIWFLSLSVGAFYRRSHALDAPVDHVQTAEPSVHNVNHTTFTILYFSVQVRTEDVHPTVHVRVSVLFLSLCMCCAHQLRTSHFHSRWSFLLYVTGYQKQKAIELIPKTIHSNYWLTLRILITKDRQKHE